MSATIIRKSILHLNYPGPVVVDLSCYAIALEITPNTEEIDIGTFCNPSATELGRTTFSAVAALLWEPALYTALQPYVGLAGLLAYAPDQTKPTEYLKFSTKFGAQPWGRFELGQRVEVDLPLAVLDTPTWQVGTMPLLDDEGTPVALELEAPDVAAAETAEAPAEPAGEV